MKMLTNFKMVRVGDLILQNYQGKLTLFTLISPTINPFVTHLVDLRLGVIIHTFYDSNVSKKDLIQILGSTDKGDRKNMENSPKIKIVT